MSSQFKASQFKASQFKCRYRCCFPCSCPWCRKNPPTRPSNSIPRFPK